MEAAARRALRESRSCRFLRSVSGTRWRSADGGLMMLVLCVVVRELPMRRVIKFVLMFHRRERSLQLMDDNTILERLSERQ